MIKIFTLLVCLSLGAVVFAHPGNKTMRCDNGLYHYQSKDGHYHNCADDNGQVTEFPGNSQRKCGKYSFQGGSTQQWVFKTCKKIK